MLKCSHFGQCASCEFESYDEQLLHKVSAVKGLFAPFFCGEFEVFASKKSGFRSRAEFRIWHDETGTHYAMSMRAGGEVAGVKGKKGFVCIDECKIVDERISRLMPVLMSEVRADANLREKLFGVEFFTGTDEMLVVLLYHKDVEGVREALGVLASRLGVKLVGRSRGKKVIFGGENLRVRLRVEGGDFGGAFGAGDLRGEPFCADSVRENVRENMREFEMQFSAEAFSQPNGFMNEKMVSWAVKNARGFGGFGGFGGVREATNLRETKFACGESVSENASENASEKGDLIEFYCGHGNFSIPLSFCFGRVFANEISKDSVKNALLNAAKNGVENLFVARMSSEEVICAFRGEREFHRLRGVRLDDYKFACAFLDPPRAGCDSSVLAFVSRIPRIIYISCNPLTLRRDLAVLCQTHEVEKFAIFDQFAYTKHVECGVVLRAKSGDMS